MDATKVIDELVSKLSEPGSRSLRLSQTTFTQIRTFTSTRPRFDEHHAQQLVNAMSSKDPSPCNRLNSELFIVFIAVLALCVPCYHKERGFSLLTDVLNNEDQGATVTQASTLAGGQAESSQRTRKSRVGLHILENMLNIFLKRGDPYTRRQLGVLILELIHECEPNQRLLSKSSATLGPKFFSFLQNEEDGALRILAALMYRELHLAQFDLTAFCGPTIPRQSISGTLQRALQTVSESPEQTNERLSWAVGYLLEITPVTGNENFMRSRPPLLRHFSCKMDKEQHLSADPNDGHSLILLSDRLTFMICRKDDSIPFFVDVPMAAIDDVQEKFKRSSQVVYGNCNLTFSLIGTPEYTLYIDGEGHKPDRLQIEIDCPRGQLVRSIKAHQRQAEWHAGSEAISPANVSAQRPQTNVTCTIKRPTPLFKTTPLFKKDKTKASIGPVRSKPRINLLGPGQPSADEPSGDEPDTTDDAIETSPQRGDWQASARKARAPRKSEPPRLSLRPVNGSLSPISRQRRAQQVQLAQAESPDGTSREGSVFELALSDTEEVPDKSAKKLSAGTKSKSAAKKKAAVKKWTSNTASARKTSTSLLKTGEMTRSSKTASRPIREVRAEVVEEPGTRSLDGSDYGFRNQQDDEVTTSSGASHVSETKLSPKALPEPISPMRSLKPTEEDDSSRASHAKPARSVMAPPPRPRPKPTTSGSALASSTKTAARSPFSDCAKSSSNPTQPSTTRPAARIKHPGTGVPSTPRGTLAGRLLPQGTACKPKNDVTRDRGAEVKYVSRQSILPTSSRQPQGPIEHVGKATLATDYPPETPAGTELSRPILVPSDDDIQESESEAESETQHLDPTTFLGDMQEYRVAEMAQIVPAKVASTESSILRTPTHRHDAVETPPTNIRAARKPNLVTFSANGPRNQGSMKKSGSLAETGEPTQREMQRYSANLTQSRGLTATETVDSGHRVRIGQSASAPESEDTRVKSQRNTKIRPSTEVAVAGNLNPAYHKITDEGSPVSQAQNLQTADQDDELYAASLPDPFETNAEVDDDEGVRGIVARGRRISEHLSDNYSRAAKPAKSAQARPPARGKKTLADSTPHEAVSEGFLNLKNDQVVKSAVVQDPFRGSGRDTRVVEERIKYVKASLPPILPVAKPNKIATDHQVDEMSPVAEPRKATPVPKQAAQIDLVGEKATKRKIAATEKRPAKNEKPAKKLRPTLDIDETQARNPPRGRHELRKAKDKQGPHKDNIAKKRLPPRTAAVGMKQANVDENTSPHKRTTGSQPRSGKATVPKALRENEEQDAEKTLVESEIERHAKGRFSGDSDSSDSDSDRSDWTDHSDSSHDPDETFVAEPDEELSPEEMMQSALLRFTQALVSPFASITKRAAGFASLFSRKATGLVTRTVKEKSDTQEGFEGRVVQSKKRVLSEFESCSATITKDVETAKRRRVDESAARSSRWAEMKRVVDTAGDACMHAFG